MELISGEFPPILKVEAEEADISGDIPVNCPNSAKIQRIGYDNRKNSPYY